MPDKWEIHMTKNKHETKMLGAAEDGPWPGFPQRFRPDPFLI